MIQDNQVKYPNHLQPMLQLEMHSVDDTHSTDVRFITCQDDEECPITMDLIGSPYEINGTTFHAPFRKHPQLSVIQLNCSHRFNGLALLYHWSNMHMRCPLCKNGTDLRLSLAPFSKEPWYPSFSQRILQTQKDSVLDMFEEDRTIPEGLLIYLVDDLLHVTHMYTGEVSGITHLPQHSILQYISDTTLTNINIREMAMSDVDPMETTMDIQTPEDTSMSSDMSLQDTGLASSDLYIDMSLQDLSTTITNHLQRAHNDQMSRREIMCFVYLYNSDDPCEVATAHLALRLMPHDTDMQSQSPIFTATSPHLRRLTHTLQHHSPHSVMFVLCRHAQGSAIEQIYSSGRHSMADITTETMLGEQDGDERGGLYIIQDEETMQTAMTIGCTSAGNIRSATTWTWLSYHEHLNTS